jgi:predicted lipoprotein with Yx(FWY)xxD motif
MVHRRHTLVAGTVLAALTLLAAACGGSGGGDANASSANTAKTASPATVAVANSDLGEILVDVRGRTLYEFGADKGTKSVCSGDCASDWPPFIAHGNATVGNGAQTALVGTSTRSDGTQQVTYNGHPLYRFSGDHKAGDTNGQGINEFGGIWNALTASGNTATAASASGGSNGY